MPALREPEKHIKEHETAPDDISMSYEENRSVSKLNIIICNPETLDSGSSPLTDPTN